MRYCYIFTLKIFLIFIWLSPNIVAQVTVINPSFEDSPSDATMPQGWHACADMTTPDIMPGYWGVYNEPSDGDTYVGIITRENGSFESFGQRLSNPLIKGECYRFAIDLAHSDIYAGYNRPLKLQIFIGEDKCDLDQLVFTSETVKNLEWKTHYIEFKADSDHQYIILKAYFKDGNFSYKGNILVDNMTSIVLCGRV